LLRGHKLAGPGLQIIEDGKFVGMHGRLNSTRKEQTTDFAGRKHLLPGGSLRSGDNLGTVGMHAKPTGTEFQRVWAMMMRCRQTIYIIAKPGRFCAAEFPVWLKLTSGCRCRICAPGRR
jgi:hypothetical protein